MTRSLPVVLLVALALGGGVGPLAAAQRRPAPPVRAQQRAPEARERPVMVAQQRPMHPAIPPPAAIPPAKPHRTGELECGNCHQGKHQGVLRMYLGMGGRGTPMIPSHMFQVSVQCVACHVVPEVGERTASIVGQTFRPSEQACVGCHGEKYRGMLGRWTRTLTSMREILEPKLAGARAALESSGADSAKVARARTLVGDADFNIRFVALGKGVHNVFYAADLLKLANGWLDEATALAGKPAVRIDDALVRGGYCAVLCHEQAGVKQPETVRFGRQRIPHVRHVTEFGAVCTACHSAEVHKAVTAKPSTCTSCHHSPRNERCESCHRAQSALYRGAVGTGLVKLEPNVMADAVACTGCHDLSHKHSRQAVGTRCGDCHDASYAEFVEEWTTGIDTQVARAAETVKRAGAAIARAHRAGRKTPEADALLREARDAVALVRKARGVHNPEGAEALLEAAGEKAEEAARRARR